MLNGSLSNSGNFDILSQKTSFNSNFSFILQYNNFSTSDFEIFTKFSGRNEHGALALEQYLFQHRSQLWHHLVWTGNTPEFPPSSKILSFTKFQILRKNEE